MLTITSGGAIIYEANAADAAAGVQACYADATQVRAFAKAVSMYDSRLENANTLPLIDFRMVHFCLIAICPR